MAVVLGGSSSERQVSLNSGNVVLENLPKDRYQAKAYDPKTDLDLLYKDIQDKQIDIVFNALHGKGGEDGALQGMLEFLGVPYTGSGIKSSAIAMDKAVSKRLYNDAGIPTPPALIIESLDHVSRIKDCLGTEIVIKPLSEGSSVGVLVKPDETDWPAIIKDTLTTHGSCLIEKYIKGRELTVGVLGEHALPIVEIRTSNAFFDYHAKYEDAATEEICPAPLSATLTLDAQKYGLQAHKTLDCRVYSRTDMILGEDDKLWVLETNTLPGLTKASLLPKAAMASGLSMSELLDQIIRLSYERH